MGSGKRRRSVGRTRAFAYSKQCSTMRYRVAERVRIGNINKTAAASLHAMPAPVITAASSNVRQTSGSIGATTNAERKPSATVIQRAQACRSATKT
jgi:hypothetical protein